MLELEFGNEFNQEVKNLPTKLTSIKFGNNFNKSVDYLPDSLIYLSFGNNFNQEVNNLPSSIEYLELGQCFSQSLNNLPKNLKILKIEYSYNFSSNPILPEKLERLSIGSCTCTKDFITNIKKLQSYQHLIGPMGYMKYFAEAIIEE